MTVTLKWLPVIQAGEPDREEEEEKQETLQGGCSRNVRSRDK